MDLGFHQFRVRIHGTMARIEVPEEEILKIADNETRTKITEKFRIIGIFLRDSGSSGLPFRKYE